MRNVICHYHIYKNSGTSFDEILTQNFNENHILFDGPFPFFSINQEELLKVIERRVNGVAFSSHQTYLPVPSSLDVNVLPVVFIREPLLRTSSIYRFKRKYSDGTFTSVKAQELNFPDWVEFCLNHPSEITHISNAQTRLIGRTASSNKPLMKRYKRRMSYDLNQALRNLNNVELLGRTEFFEKDVHRFSGILKGYGIDFKATDLKPKNVTDKSTSDPLHIRVDLLKEQLGDNLFNDLVAANDQDYKLFYKVCEWLDD